MSMTKSKEIYSNTVTHYCVTQNHIKCKYTKCTIAIVTYVDLTLKIHSTFINQTVKVLQIQLIEHGSNSIKFSISKKS